MVGQS